MRIVPVIGTPGAPLAGVAAALRGRQRRGAWSSRAPSLASRSSRAGADGRVAARAAPSTCRRTLLANRDSHEADGRTAAVARVAAHRLRRHARRAPLRGLGADVLPPIHVPPLTYAERLECWRRAVPSAADSSGAARGGAALPLRARRDRARRRRARRARTGRRTADEMLAAARADLDLGTLAQPVTPRFGLATN